MVITVQARLKSAQGRRVLLALSASLLFLFFVFRFAPPYQPRPYTLDEAIIEVVEIPDDIVIPPLMPDVPMPRQPVNFTISPEADPQTTIPDTNPLLHEQPFPPPRPDFENQVRREAAMVLPALVYKSKARYPSLAREAGLEGEVRLRLRVDARGRVVGAQVESSTAPEILVREALAAVYDCRFLPGRQGGAPVACLVALTYVFTIQ